VQTGRGADGRLARDPHLAFARAGYLPRMAAGAAFTRSPPCADGQPYEGVSVGPFVTIGEASISPTVIFPSVTIGAGAKIGDDCVVHSNSSIRERVTLGNRVVL
jgi:UDP-3-O-[3-hydroxymyristoyl] glucosamine N-acyltransferase